MVSKRFILKLQSHQDYQVKVILVLALHCTAQQPQVALVLFFRYQSSDFLRDHKSLGAVHKLHSDAFWQFLVHWGLDKPLLKIQGGHIK